MHGLALIFLAVLTCVSAESVFESESSSLNCSIYKSNKEILQSFPFRVLINPDPGDYTYARVTPFDVVHELSFWNEEGIPLTLFCLKLLTSLSIKCRNNSAAFDIPDALFSLKQLKTLQIVNCGIMAIPEAIEQLNGLDTLVLSFNNLTSLPAALSASRRRPCYDPNGHRNGWCVLDVSNNPLLTSLNVLNGTGLVTLKASNCAIDHLPLHLPNVATLELNSNKLTSLYGINTIAYKPRTLFITFSFNNNQITSIPQEIGFISYLKEIDLSDNQLTSLPQSMYSQLKLTTIKLRNNKLSEKERDWIEGQFRNTSAKVDM